jgi:hypothetical protein
MCFEQPLPVETDSRFWAWLSVICHGVPVADADLSHDLLKLPDPLWLTVGLVLGFGRVRFQIEEFQAVGGRLSVHDELPLPQT